MNNSNSTILDNKSDDIEMPEVIEIPDLNEKETTKIELPEIKSTEVVLELPIKNDIILPKINNDISNIDLLKNKLDKLNKKSSKNQLEKSTQLPNTIFDKNDTNVLNLKKDSNVELNTKNPNSIINQDEKEKNNSILKENNSINNIENNDQFNNDKEVMIDEVKEKEVEKNNSILKGNNSTEYIEKNKIINQINNEKEIKTINEISGQFDVTIPVPKGSNEYETKKNINNNIDENESFVDKIVGEKIDDIKNNNNSYGLGYVTRIQNFIIEVNGLNDVGFFEKVEVVGKAIGYVTSIKSNKVVIAILKEYNKISIGDTVCQTNEEFMGDYSIDSFGRIIDIFGNDKLVNKKFDKLFKLPIETVNIPIMDRTSVNRPLHTGIIGIDFIYPIGKGQRQLIIGDKKIGKTQICLDTIVNQKDKDMLCIYIAIGKTKKEVKEIYYELNKRGAMQNTIILTAFNDEKPPVLSLTPYFGISIAQYYLDKKKDVLVVIDDLKRHADAYREISLISGKTPGRDAYPSDIFYEHSRLLEKGCQHKNGGSITIIPVVETKGGDITDYISTNIISITDGQIVLSEKSFKKGEKPAINYGLSVSRLGGAVQNPEVKKMGAKVRQKLLSYLETREVYELANFDEMSPELQEKMKSGRKILESLSQYKFSPLSEEEILKRFEFINKDENHG